MTENRSGREAETESLSDVEKADDQRVGTKVAHDLPPNPKPAEGPRDKDYTRDTVPDASSDDQQERSRDE